MSLPPPRRYMSEKKCLEDSDKRIKALAVNILYYAGNTTSKM